MSIAKLGDYFAEQTDIKFEHFFSYDRSKYVTFLAKTNGSFNIIFTISKEVIL